MGSIRQDCKRVRHYTSNNLGYHEKEADNHNEPEFPHGPITCFDLLLEFLVSFKNADLVGFVIMFMMIHSIVIAGVFMRSNRILSHFHDQRLMLNIDLIFIVVIMIHLIINFIFKY